ncbi:MAG TPA: GNAT family protein [Solirubrobacteraceae bacterium]|jgi:RimJ/RimL family protein N-acetyltransferase
MRVALREVLPDDLPIHFEQQRDPESARLTTVPARDREAFDAQWRTLLADPAVVVRTVVVDGAVAGSVMTFFRDGEREIGYRLAQAHWGRGVATAALGLMLRDHVTERPVQAIPAVHNPASRRVLEKCGFVRTGEYVRDDGVRYDVLRLG